MRQSTLCIFVFAAACGSAVDADSLEGDSAALAGPNCADIIGGFAGFNGSAVAVRLYLAGPACDAAGYQLTVLGLDAAGAYTQLLATASRGSAAVFGDEPGVDFVDIAAFDLPLDVPTVDDPFTSSVCIFVGTSMGRHAFDRAPDVDCYEYSYNPTWSAETAHPYE